jgi:hypothetical protein
MTTSHFATHRRTLVFVSALLAACAALAGPSNPETDAQARYLQEMAFCNSGQSSQSLNTCRTEARNAFAEARRGGLNDARLLNPSRLEGSAKAGGILRESTITVPAQ